MSVFRSILFSSVAVLSSGVAAAATIGGNATLSDASDPTAITVSLLDTTSVPSLTFWGVVLLLAVASALLLKQSNKAGRVAGVAGLCLALMGVTYAAVVQTTNPDSSGDYGFTGVADGIYSVEFSAPGYQPQAIDPVFITGNVDQVLQDVVLQLMASPTNTPPLAPTETPTGTPTPSPTATSSPTPSPTPISAGAVYEVDSIVGNLRFAPSGSFTQGSPGSEAGRSSDETQFVHTLTRQFLVMETEVTRDMWADLKAEQGGLPSDPSSTSVSPSGSHPVNNVNWQQAVLFANLLSREQGLTRAYYKDAAFTIPVVATNYDADNDTFYCDFDADGYRLPSEGEWEYAARAGTTTPFSAVVSNWGTISSSCTAGDFPDLEAIAVFCANNSGGASTVGSKAANPWGLYDMHGNVTEWVWDVKASYPGDTTDYEGPATDSTRVLRGGPWAWDPATLRSADRFALTASFGDTSFGFRLVRTVSIAGPVATATPTPTLTPSPTAIAAGDVYEVDSIVGDMHFAPSGSFTQGSPGSEPGRQSDETQFVHTLTRQFLVMGTEVTRDMWTDLKAAQTTLPSDPSSTSVSSSGGHPVNNVNWRQAALFANLLSLEQGLTQAYYKDVGFTDPVDATDYDIDDTFYCDFDADGYRLPTEGEWEYAARGGTTTPFSAVVSNWGTTASSCTSGDFPDLEAIGVFCGNDSGGAATVGSKAANPWGLYDMHGNVTEWVWDARGAYPGDSTDYQGAAADSPRMVRGGAWAWTPGTLRSADRLSFTPSSGNTSFGFRLVRTVSIAGPVATATPTPTETPTPTPTPTATNTPLSAGDLYATDTYVGNLRFIPAGTFTQGSPGTEACRGSDETQFTHTLTRDFAMMETEVTRAMWDDLGKDQTSLPSDPTNTSFGSGTTNPVNQAQWYEAVLFANLLSDEQGLTPAYYKDAAFTDVIDAVNYVTNDVHCDFDASGFRLPSEGEWEFVARAGTTTPFSATVGTYNSGTCSSCTGGTHPALEAIAVFCGNDSGASNAVGSKAANPWNLYDMHGNVWEWNWDRYDSTYPGTSTDYTGAALGSTRVVRGGGWNNFPQDVRSANRSWTAPSNRNDNVGFRLVRTIP